MHWSDRHPFTADVSFDGGNLDCGNGLLLLIRKHLDPLERGHFLEVLSTEPSVEEDLPAWSRLTGNELVSGVRRGDQRSYLVCKGAVSARGATPGAFPPQPTRVINKRGGPSPSGAVTGKTVIPVRPLSVMGIGSWPRPPWMLRAVHDYLERRLDEEAFQQTADDAVRLAVAAQERAGADVVTDGEQRRDNYASYVGSRLENCQLVPITDLLPYVDDPQHFEAELRALDVPADKVRHPAVLGPLRRSQPLAVHELQFVQTLTAKPVKVALPGPYLLSRTLWLECVSERVYAEREQLAADVVRILREEIGELLAAGAALVQLDEPVLTEVVFGRPTHNRSFMCGALGDRRRPEEELAFARELLRAALTGFPADRLALHVCRGNWSRDERVALSGGYEPLLDVFRTIPVGTLFLEMCTPRAGELDVLRAIPETYRLGVGVLDQKSDRVETVGEVLARAERAVALFGPQRVLLNPDCGFATFADNPITSAHAAEAKLAAAAAAAGELRRRHGL